MNLLIVGAISLPVITAGCCFAATTGSSPSLVRPDKYLAKRTCGSAIGIRLGQEAEKLRWFPKVEIDRKKLLEQTK